MTQTGASSRDGWERARQGARALRNTLGDAATPAAPALLAAALDRAGLLRDDLPPGDPLLFGARAVLDVEMGAVWVRGDAPFRQKNVLVAHELGHLHLHYKRSEPQDSGPLLSGYYCYESDLDESAGGTAVQAANEAVVGYGPRARRETEANVFAREFLLPAPVARRLFTEDGLTASAIADRLDVPLSLVYAQLTEALTQQGEPNSEGETTMLMGDAVATPVLPPVPPDDSQRRAAEATTGPLLVGAGPGTGKTRTLVARVLYLTETRGVRPENLLLLTFSRKAAREMRERIAAQSPDAARRATIGTFHAYGLELLRRYWKEAGLPPSPVLLNRAESFALLEQRIADLPLSTLAYLHDPTFPFSDILGAIGRQKEKLVSPDDLRARADALDGGELRDKWREVAGVYAIYEELLRERGALDYSDLIARALRLLSDNADVLEAERARWRHVLVDEYQDINRAGAHLVRLLTGDSSDSQNNGAGLWAVGDLRQAIYAFRGASPANVSRWERDFPGGGRAELAVNYRSQPPLVEAFGAASGEGAAMWRAHRTGAGHITLAVADDDAAQADGIAVQMRAFIDGGYGWEDMVALCRTHNQARALRGALTERGVPVADASGAGAGGAALFGSSDARDLVALLSLACEPNSPASHLYPNGAPSELPSRAPDAYQFFAQVLWGDMGRARTLNSDNGAVSIADLLALARAFRDRAHVLVAPGANPLHAFLSHLRRLIRLDGALPRAATAASRDDDGESAAAAVRVLTVHAAKGLEFPIVFVPNLSAGKFPSQAPASLLPALRANREAEEDSDEADAPPPAANAVSDEEARLFFVALTRARDYLIVSRAEKYNNRAAKASPLLACLDSVPHLRRETWQADTFKEEGGRRKEGKREEDKLVAADPVDSSFFLPPSSFPIGAVADYLVCPRRYYYAHEAHVPSGAQGVYGAFSSAVRAALDTANPADALTNAWGEHGPHADHPHAALYRRRAEELVRNAPPALAPNDETPSTSVPLTLPHGTIELRVDRGSGHNTEHPYGRIEQRTFRKPPRPDVTEAHGDDARLHLLREAVGPDMPIAVRYLQNGTVLPAPDKPKVRAKHVAAYDDALRGIGLKVFPPAPAEGSEDCAHCPFLFVCPAE